MAIRVKHAPSAAAIGESAYTVGRGQRRERDIRFAADVALRQGALSVQARSIALQAKAREEQLAQQKEQWQEEFEFRKEQWENEPARQLEKGLQQQKILQEKVNWQYDEGQKREMAKITTGVSWLREQVSSGKWTAEQAEQAEQQLWRKYHSIIPLPVYDDKATPQEMYNSNLVTDKITGAQYRMNERGGFEAVGIGFKDYAKLRADAAKAFTTVDELTEKEIVDWVAVDKFVDDTMVRYTKIQGFASRAEEEQGRQQQKDAEQEQESQQMEMKAAVEALPVMFEKLIKGQPKIGRKKKGKPSIFRDDVYGEESYNKTLLEAVERGKRDGIAPDVIKAELDEWWDAEYDKERGRRFQKFGNRMEFEGAAREAAPDDIMSILEESGGATINIADRKLKIQNPQKFKEFALTKEGSEIVAAMSPQVAALIAAKEQPSRNDLKELGITGWSAEERKQLSSLFRGALADKERMTYNQRAVEQAQERMQRRAGEYALKIGKGEFIPDDVRYYQEPPLLKKLIKAEKIDWNKLTDEAKRKMWQAQENAEKQPRPATRGEFRTKVKELNQEESYTARAYYEKWVDKFTWDWGQ